MVNELSRNNEQSLGGVPSLLVEAFFSCHLYFVISLWNSLIFQSLVFIPAHRQHDLMFYSFMFVYWKRPVFEPHNLMFYRKEILYLFCMRLSQIDFTNKWTTLSTFSGTQAISLLNSSQVWFRTGRSYRHFVKLIISTWQSLHFKNTETLKLNVSLW